jgi:hypothetical protein
MSWSKRGWGHVEERVTTSFREVIRAVVEVVPGGVIRAGKTGYGDDEHAGFWLGAGADGIARLNVGDAAHYLKWTGERLELAGSVRTRNGYVRIVDESEEDYGEGVTLLQGAWLESGALRWRDATEDVGAFLTANNNGSGGTAVLLHAYPRTTGAGNASAITLTAHDRAYGETGGVAWALALSSAGEITTTAAARLGGGADQAQLRVAACEDGQTGPLIEALDEAGDPVFAVTPAGAVEVAGVQVLGAQQPAIADLTETGTAQDSAARAAINDILAALRAHGLIAEN